MTVKPGVHSKKRPRSQSSSCSTCSSSSSSSRSRSKTRSSRKTEEKLTPSSGLSKPLLTASKDVDSKQNKEKPASKPKSKGSKIVSPPKDKKSISKITSKNHSKPVQDPVKKKPRVHSRSASGSRSSSGSSRSSSSCSTCSGSSSRSSSSSGSCSTCVSHNSQHESRHRSTHRATALKAEPIDAQFASLLSAEVLPDLIVDPAPPSAQLQHEPPAPTPAVELVPSVYAKIVPEEIPPVPANRFLQRNVAPKESETAPATKDSAAPQAAAATVPKPRDEPLPPSRSYMSSTGHVVKGRGNFRYRSPTPEWQRRAQRYWQPRGYNTPSPRSRFDRERSQTPPHWRAEQSKTKKLSDLLRETASKDTGAAANAAPPTRDEAPTAASSAVPAAPASTGTQKRAEESPERRSFRERVPEREHDLHRDRDRDRRHSPHEHKRRRSRSTSRHRSSRKSHERRKSPSRDEPKTSSEKKSAPEKKSEAGTVEIVDLGRCPDLPELAVPQ